VYPIVLVSYLIGCENYADPAQAALVKGFFSTAISEEGQRAAAAAAGSAPISADLRTSALEAIDLIVTQ
jgi:phosphate transport system substrate-binding protein